MSATMKSKIVKQRDVQSEASLAEKLQQPEPKMSREQVVQGLGGVVHRRILDAQAQADDVVAAAEQQAAEIRAEAQRLLDEVEQIRAQAKEEGYREGKSEAAAEFSEHIIQVKQSQDEFFQNAEADIVQMVMQIVEKIMGQLAQEQQGLVIAVVREAVQSALGDRITVRVHPEDYVQVQEAQADIMAGVEQSKTLHIVEDAEVQRGGCRVETEVGTIDADIDGQLAAIRKALQL